MTESAIHEVWEFRLFEGEARLVLGEAEGERIHPLVRKIILSKFDPKFEKLKTAYTQIENMAGDRILISAFSPLIYESECSLSEAEFFHLRINSIFEPTGEECGTKYKNSKSCPDCGAGDCQLGVLKLDLRKIPENKDIAKTISDEIVVSERFYEEWTKRGFSGAHFAKIFDCSTGAISTYWRQLTSTHCNILLSSKTVCGINPFDFDHQKNVTCKCGCLVGLNLLSPVWIDRESAPKSDLSATSDFIGIREGLLRPARLMIVSKRVREMVRDCKLLGFNFEIVYIHA